MEPKILFAIVSMILSLGAFLPYVWSVFRKKAKPHPYTWIIWFITQGTASLALWYGNGGWGALTISVGTFFVGVVALLSLRYGTKNITRTDTALLVFALLALVVWWQLDAPILAVVMVSFIDVIGYIPSWRKTAQDPASEPILPWVLFSLGNFLSLLALTEYNLLTVTYLVTIMIANLVLIAIALWYTKHTHK